MARQTILKKGNRTNTSYRYATANAQRGRIYNTRPLVYVDDDINSTIALTPASCLTLNTNNGIPKVNSDEDTDSTNLDNPSSAHNLLQIWKKGQWILNTFWKIWKDEYLLSLRERKRTRLKEHRIESPFVPKVEDVTLIKDNVPVGAG
ncbi:hypothetical protein DPMN_182335 [Dreissena polymorpha]|uniref:DUF5641 domain-containing protein n=1 Tax=Dreissena polymorpha TaxID=45954 RepID=A0A9D4DG34_DREPO|nr:hypothetical protein DPMN_182335 [Dreissena polymorpha]